MNKTESIDGRERGWIKLSRKLLEHPVFTQKPHCWLTVWIALLLKANWKDGAFFDGVETTVVPAGSCITSEEKLATLTRTSRQTIRSVFAFLETTKLSSFRRTKRWTMITITNWMAYPAMIQLDQPTEQPSAEPMTDTKVAREVTNEATHGVTTIEEVKKKRREHMSNSDELNLPPGMASGQPKTPRKQPRRQIDLALREWFEKEFWPLYPRHESKTTALEAAAAKATTTEKRAFYLTRLKAQLPAYLQRKQERGQQVIPLASTWFNEDRADDELEPTPESPGRRSRTTANDDYREDYKPLSERFEALPGAAEG